MGVGNDVGTDDRLSHRRKRIARLATLPLAVGKLKVAGTDIVEGSVPEHIIVSASCADILCSTSDDHRQFSLIVNLDTRSRQDHWLTWSNHGCSELRKYDRPFRNRHMAFSSVVSVVESNADQFPGTRDWREPIRVFTSDQPTVFS